MREKRKKCRIRMKDVADELGLSINAVSLALNDRQGISEKTKKRILETAERMGYLDQTVKYIQTYSNRNVCVLLEYRFFRDFRFYGRILLGIEEAAKKDNYDVFINSFEREEVPVCVKTGKVSGIIIVGKIEDSFLNLLRKYRLPIVLADYSPLNGEIDCVVSDNRAGAYKITMHLLRKGFEKIGYFGDIEYTPSTLDRFLGYSEAMQQYFHLSDFCDSMTYVKKYSVLSKVEKYVIKQEYQKIYDLFQQIKERPQVLICSNDYMAIALMKTLQKKGLNVPKEIGITGFDDIELSTVVTPSLTTIHVQKKLMGEKAMQRLIYRILNPDIPAERLAMDVEIVERESV